MKRILIGLILVSNLAMSMTLGQAESYTRAVYKRHTGKVLDTRIMFTNFKRYKQADGTLKYTCGEYAISDGYFRTKIEYIAYDLKHIQGLQEGDQADQLDTIIHEVAHKINSDNGHTGHGKEWKKLFKEMLDAEKKL